MSRLLGAADDDEDSAEDIDDWDGQPSSASALAQPLLSGSESDEGPQDAAAPQFDPWKVVQGLAGKAGGLQQLYRPRRRKRGLCPVCKEAIRSGAHHCNQAQWKLREGQLADSLRCEGNAHFRAGRFERAVEAYARALELCPEDARLSSNRSACYSRLGRPEAALADAEAAIAAAPTWFKGHFRKARLLEARGDWDAVVEAYEIAAERCLRREERAKARQHLAAARARHAAVQQVRDMPAAFSEDLLKEHWEGRLMAGGADLEADQCAEQLQRVEAAKAEGNSAVAQGRWQEAAASYQRGLQLVRFCPAAPSREQAVVEAALLANLALAELRMGQPAEAVRHSRAVLALDPRSIKARFRLATAMGELGESEAALQEVEVALALEPSDAAVLALRRRLRQECQLAKQREKEQCSRMFRT